MTFIFKLRRILKSLGVLDSASGSEISTSRGDIYSQWRFSTRSTLIDLDVLPRVYFFLRGGNLTFRGRNKYAHLQGEISHNLEAHLNKN